MFNFGWSSKVDGDEKEYDNDGYVIAPKRKITYSELREITIFDKTKLKKVVIDNNKFTNIPISAYIKCQDKRAPGSHLTKDNTKDPTQTARNYQKYIINDNNRRNDLFIQAQRAIDLLKNISESDLVFKLNYLKKFNNDLADFIKDDNQMDNYIYNKKLDISSMNRRELYLEGVKKLKDEKDIKLLDDVAETQIEGKPNIEESINIECEPDLEVLPDIKDTPKLIKTKKRFRKKKK